MYAIEQTSKTLLKEFPVLIISVEKEKERFFNLLEVQVLCFLLFGGNFLLL